MQKHGVNMLSSGYHYQHENTNLNSSSENINKLNISCRSENYIENVKQAETYKINKEN